jgi:hypothetical protein
LDFEITIDEKIPVGLLLDELRLRQVLFNLIGNAVKFTDKGSIKVNVKSLMTSTESNNIDLVIEIQDTGFGIAEVELDSVFEPFTQQKGQDMMKFGGSGLGLSISKKLVEMMNGTITVESEIGVGSKFSVYMKGLEISSLPNTNQDFEIETSPNKNEDPGEIKYETSIEVFISQINEFLKTNTISEEFKKELDNWFIESDTARKSLHTNKLIQYITELKLLSEKYNIDPLANFSENLLHLIQTFSIAKIAYELNDLDSIHTILVSNQNGK